MLTHTRRHKLNNSKPNPPGQQIYASCVEFQQTLLLVQIITDYLYSPSKLDAYIN